VRVGGVHRGSERGEEGVEDRQRDADRVREHGRQSGRHGRRKRAHGVNHGRRPRPSKYEAVGFLKLRITSQLWSCLVSKNTLKNFTQYMSHQIIRRMHRVLNVGKK
jgi:hypothetical protein